MSLDGIVSCRGFATAKINLTTNDFYSIGNFTVTPPVSGGALNGVGTKIKIEMIGGPDYSQGTTVSSGVNDAAGGRGTSPGVITIYLACNYSTNVDKCNFEGYYTCLGYNWISNLIVLRSNANNYSYKVVIMRGVSHPMFQYYVYFSDSCVWDKTLENLTGSFVGVYAYIPNLYTIDQNGLITSPSGFNVSSSLRYKKNIENLPDIYNLDMLMKYNPITYESINDNCRHIGLIAEELDECGAKYFINYNSDNQPDSVDYAKINVHLIKCIQELNTKIDKMQLQLDSQSNPI